MKITTTILLTTLLTLLTTTIVTAEDWRSNEYSDRAKKALYEDSTGSESLDRKWLTLYSYRASAAYQYESAALAREQRALLKKQAELLDVQIQLAKEQLDTTKKAKKILTVYSNLLDSLPAILSIGEQYEKLHSKDGAVDKETQALIKLWKTATLLLRRPVTKEDLQPVLKAVLQAEGKRYESQDR